jgi:hypothetical protein
MFRNFTETVDNHIKHLYSKYDCDVYFSFWDVYGDGGFNSKYNTNKRITWDFENNKFYETEVSNDKILQQDIDLILEKTKPLKYGFEEFSNFSRLFNSKSELMDCVYNEKHEWLPHLVNVMSMYYKIYKCNELVKHSGREYDIVLRMRSDIMFRDFGLKLTKPEKNTININSWGSTIESYQDMIFYGDSIGMDKLSKLYFNLERVWHEKNRRISNEHILYTYLNIIDVNINLDSVIEFYKVNRGQINLMAGHYSANIKL